LMWHPLRKKTCWRRFHTRKSSDGCVTPWNICSSLARRSSHF
jgi:hypothetical protein